MKNIVFEYQDGWGDHNLQKEVCEFEDDATNDDIEDAFQEWVWQFVADKVCWYEED